ncbi:MAG: hypothetical protein NTW86_25005 [Candidatus Sumerlaeota bacterium]|nr:hypothetical protein [Candidatus Sumerlaeota bacterium]
MTYPFDTDNIFYVPPGKPFRIYDLLGWRKVDLFVQSARLLLDSSMAPLIHAKARRALASCDSGPEPVDLPREQERMREFLEGLPYGEGLPEARRDFEAALAPLRPSFWARFSQQPMESFFHEDYEETPIESDIHQVVIQSCVGAVAFNAVGDAECELPDDEALPLHLLVQPRAPAARVSPIDPFKPLPLIHEYCGYLGASSQGRLVTINLRAEIPEACLAAIPIRRSGSTTYETLYLHLPTQTDTPPLRAFRARDADRLARRLKAAGFGASLRSKAFSVWTRNEDVVQVYRDLPGKESEYVPQLPSFLLAALAAGSTDCAARHAMLEEVFA